MIVALAFFALWPIATAQNADREISLAFAVDGKPVPCRNLRIVLKLDGRLIVPKPSSHGFLVPSEFDRKPSEWSDKDKLDASIACGAYAFDFPSLQPGWVSPGSWEVGAAYPPYWTERFGWTTAIEKGTWLSYLESECNGCDPGVFRTVSHESAPQSVVASFQREQATATGMRARDLGYALAVFNVDYQGNRHYLLQLLHSCLSRPNESPEDDVCDARLLDYVTNLYWRGDESLLPPLLQVADARRDVIGEIGTFYSNLLERRTADLLGAMRELSPEKQLLICGLAGDDDLGINGPKFDRVARRLKAANNGIGDRCLLEAERTAGRSSR